MFQGSSKSKTRDVKVGSIQLLQQTREGPFPEESVGGVHLFKCSTGESVYTICQTLFHALFCALGNELVANLRNVANSASLIPLPLLENIAQLSSFEGCNVV